MKRLIIIFVLTSFFIAQGAQKIGYWSSDSDELPCFQYTGTIPAVATMPNGEKALIPDDPWFILGNYMLTVFPHVSGEYELITGQRSWARMNQGDKPNSGSNFSAVKILGKNGEIEDTLELTGMNSLAADPTTCIRTFGCGYAQYEYPNPDLNITRHLSTIPSTNYDNGIPALLCTITLHNTGSKTLELVYQEGIKANYIQTQYQRWKQSPLPFSTRIEVDKDIPAIKADFTPQISDPLMKVPETQISVYDVYPPTLFLYDNNEGKLYTDNNSNLCSDVQITLPPGASKTLRFVIGYTFNGNIETYAKKLLDQENAHLWKAVLPDFIGEKDSRLRSEMIWNAYVLEAMATYSNLYGETKIPQGTIYDYDWGQHASARDNFQHALPIIYYNPDLAKSVMRYMAKRTTPYGDIRLIESGSGWSETLPYCTSDQQLFFFLLLKEYLRVTSDYDFLNEEIEYFPVGCGAKASMLDVATNCFIYLKDVIGRGSHGLIRLLNSDWNDNVFVLNKVIYNDVIYSAESHMNTAMALSIFDDMAISLHEYAKTAPESKKEEALILAESMEKYRNELSTAFMEDLGDRDFTRRMYFGNEPVGEDNMYIEPMGYMLQIKDFPVEKKQKLYRAMSERIYENEKLGARQQQNPDKEGPGLEKGSRENGGMWYSMNGPIIVGLAGFDKEEAWKRLRQLTFDNFAKQFPEYWTSYWSASDNIESSLMPSEGLADQSLEYHTIPVFCAHPHAWLLYCYYIIKNNDKRRIE